MDRDADLKEILLSAKTIASVGLSSNPDKESYRIASYLKAQGYRVIPVNPTASEIMGETSRFRDTIRSETMSSGT